MKATHMQIFRSLMVGIWHGKTPARTLFNTAFSEEAPFSGKVVDIGGTKNAGYRALATFVGDHQTVTVNCSTTVGAEIVADAAHIPELPDSSVDAVWCFNLLEHVKEPGKVLQEIERILKPNGRVALCIPFLVRVHPDPTDYQRFTAQGLEHIVSTARLHVQSIQPLGYGPCIAAFMQLQPLFPRIVATCIFPMFFIVDRIFLKMRPQYIGTWPVGYYVNAVK